MAIIKEIYTRSNGSKGIRYKSDKPSQTNKNYKNEVDVNNIMDRFLKTGQLTHVSSTPMEYLGENPQIHTDLQQSLNYIKNMEDVYKSLNKKFKNKFKTIEEFFAFAQDPKNADELQKIMSPKTTTNQTTTKNDENKVQSESSEKKQNESPS